MGFGLSDRPHGSWYLPENQAANLRTLIERLGLRDVTLVLHDFGGPFGLSYALERPENVRSLVLMNTWMWSLARRSALRALRPHRREPPRPLPLPARGTSRRGAC